MKKVEKTKRMRQAKRDTLWKEIETEGKWQKNMKQKILQETKRNDYKKGKTRRYTKGKNREKRDEKEKTQQKELKGE